MANHDTRVMNSNIEELLVERESNLFSKDLKLWSNEQDVIKVVLKFLSWKIPFFKNRKNDSYLIIRSFLITLVTLPLLIYFAYVLVLIVLKFHESQKFMLVDSIKYSLEDLLNYVLKHPKKSVSFILPTYSIVYWNFNQKFAGQWRYCADLYNKISFENIDKLSPRELLYQRSTLALDLLQLDLYAHKSFKKTFNDVLYMSIIYVYKYKPNKLDELKGNDKFYNFWWNGPPRDSIELEVEKFVSGKGSVRFAAFYISQLQNDLDFIITEEKSSDLMEYGVG